MSKKYFELNGIVLEADRAILNVLKEYDLDDDEFEWIYTKLNLSFAQALLRFKKDVTTSVG